MIESDVSENHIQKKLLEVFIEFDKICKKHDLHYYAIGGTCLGAVRHQGFIPWDDDIDVAMPRNEYEKFKNTLIHELPDNLRVLDINQEEHYACPFMKIHNINTTFIEKGMYEYPDRYTGVYIDIMPLDGIPDGKWQRKVYFFKLLQLARLDWHRKYELNQKLNEGKSIGKRLFWRIIYFFIRKYPINFFSERYVQLQKKYSYEKTKDLCYTWSRRASKIIFPKEDFEDYILLPFEGVQMRCPVGYDNFLNVLYGDYMKLPPQEERVPCHEVDILDLEKSYLYYMKEG